MGDIGSMADKFSMPVEKVSKFANLMSMVGANTDRGIWKF
jgi:hypothetical protein